ncbi:S9 family peptidase [Luteipulveratus sp. YIM 133132]|uniref:S9 family peptidase n=1 Tax=Luteipulveratus flavus TaxID=3031728 RepID=A0ABT6C7G2_9MICO|nr:MULTISPECIES: S9 family peptidase [unclassified Luteipulveratus]MDE9366469.1 S9 family peptidase [Luteipulveratus sp. YIM 133132]MDF8264257.1 S9 family peptidase [Luteipulveratus sp. YIM 133296]
MSSTSDLPSSPPVARRVDHVREHHGDRFVDPWEWLRDGEDPEVIAHLEAENAYTRARTSHLADLSEQIFQEMRSRIRETDLSVPVRLGDWWYYSRTQEGAQYETHCRSPYDADGPRPTPEPGRPAQGEQVLLDSNVEAEGREFYELGDLEVSVDGTQLALLYDVRGDERYDLEIRDIERGSVVDDGVRGAGNGLVWSLSGEYVFYTRRDEAWRAFQVWRHRVGGDVAEDELILQEDDELYSLGIEASRDERWLVVHVESRTTTEAHLLDLQEPTGPLQVVQPRTTGLDYGVEVDGDRVLVVHNASRVDFDLAWAPITDPGRDSWSPLLSGTDGERILAAHAFASFVAVSMRREGLPVVRVIPKTAQGYGEPVDVPTPTALARVSVGSNPAYETAAVQVVVESFLFPRTVLDLDPATGETQVLKQREVPGYDADRYVEERLWAEAPDGTQVPVSLVRRRELDPDGTNAGFVYGYGSYEVSIDPYFSAVRLSMLDRGVVYAVAHVRGGGEMGRRWWDEGKLTDKKNTFTDFVAASRALVEQGWVAPDRLVAEGGSAGGLLIGAVVNMAPELYRAVHAAVPFVDALTTILDPSLPLTVGEWEEWGNPLADPEVYAYMKSYSPYENIEATRYPAILATTSLNDTRVFFVEPAKWVQALRERITSDQDERPVLLKTEMVAGHGGQSGRYDAWRDAAFETAFLLDAVGAVDLRE